MPIPNGRVRPLARVALLAASVGLTGCELAVSSWSAEARDTWTRSYTLGADGRFELANKNGSITVERSADGQVHVKAEKIGKGATEAAARDVLKRVEIIEQADASRVRLESKTPSGMFEGGAAQVVYTVQVPPAVTVKIDNTNGRIHLSDLEGTVEAETTNGGIEGRGLRGPVKAGTTNGGIQLDVASLVAGGVELETTNGGIEISLPGDAKADISASCTNGGIDTGELEVETTESSRRRLEGRLNGGGPRVRLETVNGGIRLARR